LIALIIVFVAATLFRPADAMSESGVSEVHLEFDPSTPGDTGGQEYGGIENGGLRVRRSCAAPQAITHHDNAVSTLTDDYIQPPEASMVAPVRYGASGESRNAAVAFPPILPLP
jgi:hypothetical protein